MEWKVLGQLSGDRNESEFVSYLNKDFGQGAGRAALAKGIDTRLAHRRTEYLFSVRHRQSLCRFGGQGSNLPVAQHCLIAATVVVNRLQLLTPSGVLSEAHFSAPQEIRDTSGTSVHHDTAAINKITASNASWKCLNEKALAEREGFYPANSSI